MTERDGRSPEPADLRRTKIVATLGPACDADGEPARLVAAGVDVVRVNLAHGALDEHAVRIDRARAEARRQARVVGVLADLPGAKVRTTALDGTVQFDVGAEVEITVGASEPSTAARIVVPVSGALAAARPGDEVALADDAVRLWVLRRDDGVLVAEVVSGGTLQGRPAFRVARQPGAAVLGTPHDERYVAWCVEQGVDFVGVSFVCSRDDIDRVRDLVGPRGPSTVAKIETADAIAHLDEVVAAADVVMVARGDLGVECPLEDVPHLQKRIIRACIAAGRPVITATQMLESMTDAPVPTRAEASDVANAVLDGTDAVMLSGETAIGAHPTLVVETMDRIVRRAEQEVDPLHWGRRLATPGSETDLAQAMTHAAWRASLDAGVAAILCCTETGATARTMARFRPAVPLLALSSREQTIGQLSVTWGTSPLRWIGPAATGEPVGPALDAAVAAGWVSTGDVVAVLWRADGDSRTAADTLRLATVP